MERKISTPDRKAAYVRVERMLKSDSSHVTQGRVLASWWIVEITKKSVKLNNNLFMVPRIAWLGIQTVKGYDFSYSAGSGLENLSDWAWDHLQAADLPGVWTGWVGSVGARGWGSSKLCGLSHHMVTGLYFPHYFKASKGRASIEMKHREMLHSTAVMAGFGW